MDSSTRTCQIREQLLDNPHFVFKPSDHKHFGCPISDAAKLEIRKVQHNLYEEAESLLEIMGQRVVTKFLESETSHKQLSAFVEQFIKLLTDIEQLTEAEVGLTAKRLEVLPKFGNSTSVDMDSEICRLIDVGKCLKHLSSVDTEESESTRKTANGKLELAMLKMGTALQTQFRKAQRNLVAEVDGFLNSIHQKIVLALAESTDDDSLFDSYYKFVEKLEALAGTDRSQSLDILSEFCDKINVDMDEELEKLKDIFQCLKFLTQADAEQSVTTWSEVGRMWDHAMEFIKKDIEQLKAKREVAEAVAKGKLAEAEAELVRAKAREDLLLAKVEAEKDRAEAEARTKLEVELVKAKAREELLAAEAEMEKYKAEVLAKDLEIAKAKAEQPSMMETIGETVRVAKSLGEVCQVAAQLSESWFATDEKEEEAERKAAEAKAREEELLKRLEKAEAEKKALEAKHKAELEASKSNCSIQ